jgi:uncharacterized membrane protein YdbT with pleckstrin-like domain
MTYAEQSLTPGERITWQGRRHWWHMVAAPLGTFIAGIILTPLFGIGLLVLAVDLLIVLPVVILLWRTEQFAVTDQRVLSKRGLLARRTDEVALRHVESVQVQQGIAGRLWNYGDLAVQGSGGHRLVLPMVTRPQQLRAAVQQGVHR